MRKNIYNDKLLMIKIKEMNCLFSYKKGSECPKDVLEVLRSYLSINSINEGIYNFDFEIGKLSLNDEIALSLDDENNRKLEKAYKKFTENYGISLEEINNTFLWAITTNADKRICDMLKFILIKRYPLTEKVLEEEYGNDLLEFILLHKDYDYVSGVNPVIDKDKKVLLITNGQLKEIEVNTTLNQETLSSRSYQELGNYLEYRMGSKIDFQKRREVEKVVQVGEYHRTNDSKGIPFFYEFVKDDSLSIEVSSFLKDDISRKDKLLVLRDFYEILKEQYGEPSTYTIKRDEKKEALYLDWYFRKKENVSEIRNEVFFLRNNLEIIDNWCIGSKEGSFEVLIEKQLQEMDETPLYDNDMELEKKPTNL